MKRISILGQAHLINQSLVSLNRFQPDEKYIYRVENSVFEQMNETCLYQLFGPHLGHCFEPLHNLLLSSYPCELHLKPTPTASINRVEFGGDKYLAGFPWGRFPCLFG
jgi:hypothetical protein